MSGKRGMDMYIKKSTIIIAILLATASTIIASDQKVEIKSFLQKLFPHAHLPYIKLTKTPAPIKHLKNLGTTLQTPFLYLKDESPISPFFGGNKIRKLEFLLADALQKGCTEVITVGSVGSNHATATAIHAQRLGLKCRVLLLPQRPTHMVKRNLLLMQHSNAIMHYCKNPQEQKQIIISLLKEDPNSRYFIPVGGSGALGDLGFVAAAFELKKNIEKGLIPEPDFIYLCLGSGGSAAGLTLGAKLAGLTKTTIIPVSIGKNNENIPATASRMLKHYYAMQKHLNGGNIFSPLSSSDVPVNTFFATLGYAEMSKNISQAVRLMQQHEKINLDTTYTGKVLAAMMHDITHKKLHNKTLLLWNTFCGSKFTDIVGQEDYRNLPKELHFYFETPINPLDVPLKKGTVLKKR